MANLPIIFRIPKFDLINLHRIPKFQLFYLEVKSKIANFALSKDGRIREPKQLKLKVPTALLTVLYT